MATDYFIVPCATSLQNSVWITPDPLTEERQILGGGKINVESLLLQKARPCAQSLAHRMGEGGRRPGEGWLCAEIVAGAWDFERINPDASGLHPASENPRRATGQRALQSEICHLQSSEAWRAAAEREAWLEAVTNPDASGLPGRILPSDYLGQSRRVGTAGGSAPGRQPATAHVQIKLVAADVSRLKFPISQYS